jgi:hypothetical protein
MINQNNRERLTDQMQRGLITAAEANIKMVRDERFRVVHKLSRVVRKALNFAVKKGELEHFRKDGLKPEVYYHPNFKYLAIEARSKEVNYKIKALKAICK